MQDEIIDDATWAPHTAIPFMIIREYGFVITHNILLKCFERNNMVAYNYLKPHVIDHIS